VTTAFPKYARGLDAVTESTTPDGAYTTFAYEPYGRLQAIYLPDPSVPAGVETYAGVSVEYNDVSSPRTIQQTIDDGTNAHVFVTALDGYGRSRGRVAPADVSAGDQGPFIVSGQETWNARGSLAASYSATFSTTGQSVLSPSTPSRRFTYDAFGRTLTVNDLSGIQTLGRTYLALGYTEQDADQLNPGGPLTSSGVAAGLATAVGLNGHGRVTVVETTTGKGSYVMTSRTYLPTGELSGVSRSGVDVTGATYSYARTMQYDSLGRLALNYEPSSSWAYAYNDAGQIIGTTDGRGCGENIAYDGAGRPQYEDYFGCTSNHLPYSAPNATTGEGAEVLYSYDPQGRLSALYDRAAYTSYGYDYRSRVTSVQRRLVQPQPQAGSPGATAIPTPLSAAGYAPHAFVQEFGYDDLDRLTAQTTGEEDSMSNLNGVAVPFGSTTSTSVVSLQYSQRGVLASVGGSYGPLIRQAAYDPNGLPLATSWGDIASPPAEQNVAEWGTIQGTQTTYTYDSRLRLQERITSRVAPSLWGQANGTVPPVSSSPTPVTPLVLEKDIYTLDPIGNPTNIADGRTAGEWPLTAQPVTRAMIYDNLYHLANVTYSYAGGVNTYASPTAAGAPTESPLPLQEAGARIGFETSTYDPFGNRTNTTDDTSTFFDRSLGTVTTGTSGTSTSNQIASAVQGST
jgi:YD repeat-containing protein